MKKTITTLLLTLICIVITSTVSAQATKHTRVDRGIEKIPFVNKGQWFAAGTASYMSLSSNDFKFIILDKMNTDLYSFSGKVLAGYCLKDDLGVGLGFDYSRTMIDLPNVSIDLGDSEINIQNFYSIEQLYSGTAFLRTYINLGNSRRFGLFNDLKISLGGGQGKIYNGAGDALVGTYQKIFKAGLLIQPGVTVFITDYFAVETSIGLLGLQYSRTEQITNQVYQGSYENWGANFKINIFSINLGLSFYF